VPDLTTGERKTIAFLALLGLAYLVALHGPVPAALDRPPVVGILRSLLLLALFALSATVVTFVALAARRGRRTTLSGRVDDPARPF
jgi:hypothetical protein